MVTALLAQNKFNLAIELAKENYEQHPENSYQIHGYFRCLVRKKPLNRNNVKMLEKLLHAMNENFSDKHEELYAAMNIEYQDFVCHRKVKDMLELIQDARTRFPDSINVTRASQPFMLLQSIITQEEVFPKEE